MAPDISSNKIPMRLIVSYILDWLVIIAVAAAGGGLNWVEGYKRPFSLLDLNISYPLVEESISTGTLIGLSLGLPAAVIALVVAVFVPGRIVSRSTTRKQLLRLKAWEFEKGWAGLALSLAVAFFVTQAGKLMFGKPRPSLLARCQPDLTDIAKYVVGGYGQDISARWTLVSAKICTQTNASTLNDGFKSFPSGHSSFSWSGLLYLTLFLCSKFQITIPYLPQDPTGADSRAASMNNQTLLPFHNRERTDDSAKPFTPEGAAVNNARSQPYFVRSSGASPPTYLLILALVPVALAIYICSTRWAEFYHFASDIISGALIGILTSWFSFRWYHLPVLRGQGWAWGPRTRSRAFLIGVGTGGWVDYEGRRRQRVGRLGNAAEAERARV